MNVSLLFILLIVLVVIAAILLNSISKEYVLEEVKTINQSVSGGSPEPIERKKVIVVDGLNYIYDKFLTTNKPHAKDLNDLISNYPNIIYVWKAISTLRASHKKEHVVFVIKNQEGYRISVYEDKLYKKWSKQYKLTIVMCYDPSKLSGPHYIKGRDDKTVCELYDKYKEKSYEVELLSKDSYNDRANFGSIPVFKKIVYGNIPYINY